MIDAISWAMFTNACVFSLCSIFFYASAQEERSPELITPSGRVRTSARARSRSRSRSRSRAGRQFLDEMAVAEGSGEEGDEEEEEEEEQEQQEGFAFAVDPSSPLDFNFELFLLDSLSLPCGIEKRGDNIPAAEAVNFETPARAIAYCTEKIEQGWRATLPPTSSQMLVTASRQLDKRTLFQRDGRSLAKALKSGQQQFDASLKEVRLDRLALIKVTILMNRLGNLCWTHNIISSLAKCHIIFWETSMRTIQKLTKHTLKESRSFLQQIKADLIHANGLN